MKKIILSEKVICECKEEIKASVHDVLNFDSVECPTCGSDVYYTNSQYVSAESVAYIH